MLRRDFSQRYTALPEWVTRSLAGLAAFGVLLAFVPWGVAAIGGVFVSALLPRNCR